MLAAIEKSYLSTKLPEFVFNGTWIAGGAVRDSILGVIYDDIDVFGRNNECLDLFIQQNLSTAKLIHDDALLKSYTLAGQKIQVIYRNYDSIEDCLFSFDYTICQFAYDGDQIHCNPSSLVDLYRKKLVVNKLDDRYVLDSLRRMQKYIQKGYSICNGGLIQVVEAIRRVPEEVMASAVQYYPDSNEPRIVRFD